MRNHEKVLAKVRALLDQAEATDYEEEAHAFIAGAERLMAKYGIEEALVMAAGRPVEDSIDFKRFYVDAGRYETPRLQLISSLARAHGLTNVVVGYREYVRDDQTEKGRYRKWIEVAGYQSDLDYLEMLVTSLVLQLGEAIHDPEVVQLMRRETFHPSHVVAWKNAFTLGFGSRVASRIREARREAMRDAEEALAEEQPVADADAVVSSSVALAVRDKDRAVKSAFDTRYPRLVSGGHSTAGSGGGSGFGSGHRAGSSASLGGSSSVGGRKGQLAS